MVKKLSIKEKFGQQMQDYIYFERYVNDGSPSGFSKNTTSKETAPLTGQTTFQLLEFDDSDCQTFLLGEQNPIFMTGKNYAHPDAKKSEILKDKPLEYSKYMVSPTANGRTMILLDDNIKGFLKLSYDTGYLGRTFKYNFLFNTLQALEKSFIIKKAIDVNQMPNTFSILPESSAKVSILTHNGEPISYSTIYREFTPYPHNMKKNFMIPAFALFSKDYFHKNEEAFINIFIINSGKSPLEYLWNIINMTIDVHFNLALKLGFYPEMHAQNILYEIDENLNVVRLILRDMEDVNYNQYLAKQLELLPLQSPFLTAELKKQLEILKEKDSYEKDAKILGNKTERQQFVSYFYDFKMGEYLLDPIISCVCNKFDLDESIIYELTKQKIKEEYLPLLPENYFPNDWYSVRKEFIEPGTSIKKYFHSNHSPKFR